MRSSFLMFTLGFVTALLLLTGYLLMFHGKRQSIAQTSYTQLAADRAVHISINTLQDHNLMPRKYRLDVRRDNIRNKWVVEVIPTTETSWGGSICVVSDDGICNYLPDY